MSVVRKYVVKPRLAELIKRPGGISAREALRRADTVIADAREGCLAEIDRLMARIREESLAPVPDTETIYSLSADMVAVCVGPDDEALAQVGKSLCDLIDRTAVAGQVNRTALEVHLSSMRALHRTGADAATRRALLDGLAKVVAKLDV